MILKNKTALITGGSRGIGLVVARRFVEEGARVFIFARNRQEVNKAVSELNRGRRSEAAFGLTGDVSLLPSVRRAVKRVSKPKGIDVLVNCAGRQEPIGPFVKNDTDEWRDNLSVNLLGTAYFCHEVMPLMMKRRRGKIINFSGGGGTGSRPNFSAYAVAKTGVIRLTEILAEEARPYRIDINSVAPGAVNTQMLNEVIKAGVRAGKKEMVEAKARLKAGGTPPELAADLVVFLASPKSDGLSGKIISAVWDDWKKWKKAEIKEITKSQKYTLRRMV